MSSVLLLALAYPIAIAVLFWLAFLRPVQQHQKKQRDELANLRVGDEVLTQAGFIARIKEIRVPEEQGPTEIILDLGGVMVRATASAVLQRVHTAGGDAAAQPERLNAERAQGSPNA
jgi:preprotein translocase YajC subunit